MERFLRSLLLVGLLCVCLMSATATAAVAAQAVAGRVETPVEVAPYLLVKAVDSTSGMAARTSRLDATRTFTFAGLPASVDTIEVISEIPAHLFTLQPHASMLSATVPTSPESPMTLKVSVQPVEITSRRAHEENKGSVGTAVVTCAVLVVLWFGRSTLIAYLDLPGLRMPKQKKVMVPR